MRCRLDVYHPYELNREEVAAVAAVTGFKPTYVERTLAEKHETYDSMDHEYRRYRFGDAGYFSHWLGQFHDNKSKPYENGALVILLDHTRQPYLEKDDRLLFGTYIGTCLRTRQPVGSGMVKDEVFDWLARNRFTDEGRIDHARVLRFQKVESIINNGAKKLRWHNGLEASDLQTRTFKSNHLLCFNYTLAR